MSKENGTQEEQVNGQEEENKEPQKTPGEIAAEERAKAAEIKAEQAEEENNKLKTERSQSASNTKTQHPASGYSVSSFSEQEWTDVEASTGLDRKAILFNLNQRIQIENQMDKKMQESVGVLQTRIAVQQEKESLAADDPLYPKYRKEVDKFLEDIPTDLMKTDDGRKKWIRKAFDYAKKSVKIANTSRQSENMSTKNTTGKGNEKEDSGSFSVEEKEVFSSHGKTEEDYNKIKHPFLKDGIMIKEQFEVPKFGNK